jgi:glutamate/tyrosine decarboxylase-like PLP-dependent enzyme
VDHSSSVAPATTAASTSSTTTTTTPVPTPKPAPRASSSSFRPTEHGYLTLQLWFELQNHGLQKYREDVSSSLKLCSDLASSLKSLVNEGMVEILSPKSGNYVIFRFKPKKSDDFKVRPLYSFSSFVSSIPFFIKANHFLFSGNHLLLTKLTHKFSGI